MQNVSRSGYNTIGQLVIILSLKLIGGFSNKEISRALLKKEDTVAKSFTRAKKKFKESVKTLEIPVEMNLTSRINTVVKVIYLLFSAHIKLLFVL